MTASGYLELSRLWQEQVDPVEQATIRTVASDIERTALRRRAIDFVLALVGIGMVVVALLVHPGSMPVRIGLAATIALMMWTVWMRQQLLKAARALSACEPETFFAAAVKNALAELNYHTFSLWTGGPAGLLVLVLLLVPEGLGSIELLVRELSGPHLRKIVSMILTLLLLYCFFIPANMRLREQLRRLEAMKREWEMEDAQ